MSPSFLRVLNFLPSGLRNTSSQRAKNSTKSTQSEPFADTVAGLAAQQHEHHPETKEIQCLVKHMSTTQPKQGSRRRLSLSSLKRRLGRVTSKSSLSSRSLPSPNSAPPNEDSVLPATFQPSYQKDVHHDDSTIDTITENMTTGCTIPTQNKAPITDITLHTALWTPPSPEAAPSVPSFESLTSTLSSLIPSYSTSSAYSCTENCFNDVQLLFGGLNQRQCNGRRESEHDEREGLFRSSESATLRATVGGTVVGKNKDIHAYTDAAVKTITRSLRLPCQQPADETQACDHFHCHNHHADDEQVQQNKQEEQYHHHQRQYRQQQHNQRGEEDDTSQHEEAAHGIVFSSTCNYIFDYILPVLPPPSPLPSHSPCMPPQEYIPQPGIDDETPRQIHKTKTYLIQDPLTRFEIIERLGYGSSGSSVFKALDKADNLKTIAIKKIPLSTLSDGFGGSEYNRQVDVDYFISCIADHGGCWRDDVDQDNEYDDYEVEMRRKPFSKYTMGLERIVQCLGVHQTDKELWLSLEFCGGGSVEDLIRLSDGPLAESEIGWVMSQILQGLVYLHSKDHIHGDIKASNILLTNVGKIKLGGSGSVMNHKEGAGERKRRRRSLTMTEFPTSWLAPESNPSSPTTPTSASEAGIKDWATDADKSQNDIFGTKQPRWMPNASAATDVWALGVACIELSQGRPPGPDMPILALFGERRIVGSQSTVLGCRSDGSLIGSMGWKNIQQTESFGAAGMGMSEDMWSFIARCLTPEPEARPSVQDLLEDPFIERYSKPSEEFLERIQRMMEFVDQCASISSDMLAYDMSSSISPSTSSSSTLSSSSTSLTLSPSKASLLVDMKLDEAGIASWVIPMVRPRVDSVYDASSFFDNSGLPTTPPEPGSSNHVSGWKHQRVSHPVVKQALLCEQAGYMIFRHSRSPSLATIVESQLEDDKEIGLGQLDDHMIEYGGFRGVQCNDVTCEMIVS